MEKIQRTMADKLNVPKELLKKLDISKGDNVEFTLDEENLTISISKFLGEIEPIIEESKNKSEDEENKEYDLIIRKRNTVTIPNEIFKTYNLQYQDYSTNVVRNNDKITITLVIGEQDFKFRKENVISLNDIGKKHNILFSEGIKLKLIPIFLSKNELTLIKLIFSYKDLNNIIEQKEKENEEINKAVSNAISEIKQLVTNKTKCESLEKEDIISSEQSSKKVMSIQEFLNKGSSNKFTSEQVNSAVKTSIKENSNKDEQDSIKSITYDLPRKNKKIEEIKEEKTEEQKEKELEEYRNLINSKLKSQSIEKKDTEKEKRKLEKRYYDLAFNKKLNNKTIFFINKFDLSDELECFICNKELTSEDDSMKLNHRICNSCKKVELRKFFAPLFELVQINQQLKELEENT